MISEVHHSVRDKGTDIYNMWSVQFKTESYFCFWHLIFCFLQKLPNFCELIFKYMLHTSRPSRKEWNLTCSSNTVTCATETHLLSVNNSYLILFSGKTHVMVLRILGDLPVDLQTKSAQGTLRPDTLQRRPGKRLSLSFMSTEDFHSVKSTTLHVVFQTSSSSEIQQRQIQNKSR